jgi:hypothetical protein
VKVGERMHPCEMPPPFTDGRHFVRGGGTGAWERHRQDFLYSRKYVVDD